MLSIHMGPIGPYKAPGGGSLSPLHTKLGNYIGCFQNMNETISYCNDSIWKMYTMFVRLCVFLLFFKFIFWGQVTEKNGSLLHREAAAAATAAATAECDVISHGVKYEYSYF